MYALVILLRGEHRDEVGTLSVGYRDDGCFTDWILVCCLWVEVLASEAVHRQMDDSRKSRSCGRGCHFPDVETVRLLQIPLSSLFQPAS